ncbi:hypothetical protein P4133_01490 [Pseudomonas aeruginosa]|nr:hypothetical protein [Pseudomonas aeruginosa]
MKITADQTRELLQLLVEVDGQSKAAAKQVFNGITPDGRLALLHDLRRRKLLAKPAPAQQLAKGEEEGEKVRAGKAKKVPYTLLMPPDQLEALRNLAERTTRPFRTISGKRSGLTCARGWCNRWLRERQLPSQLTKNDRREIMNGYCKFY